MDIEQLKRIVTDTIPWVKMSGIRVDIIEPHHVSLTVPVAPVHLNHIGVVFAGTHFMLMEVSAAALFAATYGLEKFVPVNREMTVRFIKPAMTDIICDLRIDPDEASRRLAAIEEKGRGEWPLEISVRDSSGVAVSRSTCSFFVIPRPTNARFGS